MREIKSHSLISFQIDHKCDRWFIASKLTDSQDTKNWRWEEENLTPFGTRNVHKTVSFFDEIQYFTWRWSENEFRFIKHQTITIDYCKIWDCAIAIYILSVKPWKFIAWIDFNGKLLLIERRKVSIFNLLSTSISDRKEKKRNEKV